MGSRAFAERLLLRPSTFTRTTPRARLAPSWTAQRCLSNTAPRCLSNTAPRCLSNTAPRCLSNTAPRCLSNTTPKPAPRPETPDTATTPEVAAASPQRPRTTSAAASQAIDDLFAPPSAAPDASHPTAPTPRYDHVFGAQFSKPSRGRLARAPKLAFDSMLMPESVADPSPANKPTAATLAAIQTATFENYPRLNPTYGRSVDLDVSRGRDIVRGIGMLGSLVARNKVKSDFNKQRFHERGGLKRKRLNSERWRARFKLGFHHVTGRVMELTRKGW